MEIAIYIISSFITNVIFSVATSILIVFGIEKTGEDPGTPGIMLISLLCINGILSIVTAATMGSAKAKYKKEFPAKFSALIFLLTYFPFHVFGIFFFRCTTWFSRSPSCDSNCAYVVFFLCTILSYDCSRAYQFKRIRKKARISRNLVS